MKGFGVVCAVGALFAAGSVLAGQAGPPRSPAPQVKPFVATAAPVVALTHVTLIDGSGKPARRDQTVVVEGEKIAAIGPSASTSPPAGAEVLDLSGHTVTPGIVGLHDHMYYGSPVGGSMRPMLYSYPRLFLASGVTTIRTTGSVDSYQELNLREAIAAGEMIGPEIHVTGPYLQGVGPGPAAMHRLKGPEDARRVVRYWAEEGVTWFKAYTQITRAELGAAIDEAHKHGVKVTAHLCSVGFREAVSLGIDSLEHGLLTNSEYWPGKKPDECPTVTDVEMYGSLQIENNPDVQRTIDEMVARKVSMTSTLAVMELAAPSRIPLDPRVLEVLHPDAAAAIKRWHAEGQTKDDSASRSNLKKAMAFERLFVKRGGLLAAGSDPCCLSVVAGYGDHRNFELLVEAGFTVEEAIQIMTLNGARVLGIDERVGLLAPGKQADMMVIKGDLTGDATAVRNVTSVFRRGLGYDPQRILPTIRGVVGAR
jgi:imidazolonepropionase-like amidohydrolase